MQKAIKALITINALSLLLLVLYRPAARASVWIGMTETLLQHSASVTTERPLYGIKTSDKIVALTFR